MTRHLNKTATFLATTLAAIGLSGAALAQTMPEVKTFAELDADASGSLSFEEAAVAWPDLTPEIYATIDTDVDGMISEDEFTLYLETKASTDAGS